ncbi:MAG: acetyl-CoA carboxylase carboxyltransferase subunit alpha [Lentisphaerae bacterium RIFOXYA12_FULL_48_11]|nr:MAG: acetyl-CoA carboxylase carboxyltransferase subunit alpha [Lentisphaerae bacterium RIFOXYA12_FULL_48_11]
MNLDFEKNAPEIEEKIAELTKQKATDPNAKVDDQIVGLKKELDKVLKEAYAHLTPWQTVQVARHPNRPLLRDYIAGMCGEFIELHGDRCFGDDKGIIGGFATIADSHVMIIGHQKGKNLEDNVKSNFGMATPEGYRKALRLMKLAEKFKIPIITFIDTPGAYPGADAEARGQAEAIARNLTEMSQLEVPVIVVVTGEGGSGGALGIGVGDVILMLSNSVYSVISPEGCASILWRDGSKAPEAAEALKITANSLFKLGIVDEIIPEPIGGAHRDYDGTLQAVKQALLKHLNILRRVSERKLVDRRFEKYCRIGRFKHR